MPRYLVLYENMEGDGGQYDTYEFNRLDFAQEKAKSIREDQVLANNKRREYLLKTEKAGSFYRYILAYDVMIVEVLEDLGIPREEGI